MSKVDLDKSKDCVEKSPHIEGEPLFNIEEWLADLICIALLAELEDERE